MIAVDAVPDTSTRLLVLDLDGIVVADLGATWGPPAWQPRP
jgi:hypothetical protein